MYSRLAITLLIFLLGWLAYQGLSRLVLSRRSKGDLLLDEYQPGRPAILYFSSPDCIPCKTIQRPALDRLMASLKDDMSALKKPPARSKEGYIWRCGLRPHRHIPLLSQLTFLQ